MTFNCTNIECPDVGKEVILKNKGNNTKWINGVLIPEAILRPVCRQDMELVIDFKNYGFKKPLKDRGKKYYEK